MNNNEIFNKLYLKKIRNSIIPTNDEYIHNWFYCQNGIGCDISCVIYGGLASIDCSLGEFLRYVTLKENSYLFDYQIKDIALILRSGKVYNLYNYDYLNDFINDIINYLPVEYIVDDLFR